METRQKITVQMIWGALLMLAGIGIFFRIPQVMPQIEQIESFASSTVFIRICLYLLGCLLIGGGFKKIRDNYKLLSTNVNDRSSK